MPTFTATFTPPAAVTNLSATADVPTSSVTLVWDPSADPAFALYRVFRTLGGVRSLLREISILNPGPLVDYDAPLQTSVTYDVVVVNLDGIESDPAAVETQLESGGWWIVSPGSPERTFELTYVSGYDDVAPLEDEKFRALGRSRTIVVQGELMGVEGSIRVRVPSWAWSLVPKLRDMSRLSEREFVLLKSPFGEVYRVALGSISRTRAGAGWQEISVPYVEVGDRVSSGTLGLA